MIMFNKFTIGIRRYPVNQPLASEKLRQSRQRHYPHLQKNIRRLSSAMGVKISKSRIMNHSTTLIVFGIFLLLSFSFFALNANGGVIIAHAHADDIAHQTEEPGHMEEKSGHGSAATIFLWIAIILLAAKISSLIERFGQPSVLGELVIGVILGNLVLLGIGVFEPLKADLIIAFLAELGVVILLFQIGLESNISRMREVGIKALLVACVGVAVPFILGTYIVGPYLLPGQPFSAYLFIGATLTATSVGITARVFRDLGKLQSREAQIVLGAAVIDDVL